MKTEVLKVLRPFYLDSKPTKVGDIVEVPFNLAVELRTAKKAERHQPPAPSAPADGATAENTASKVPSAAKPQKGEK